MDCIRDKNNVEKLLIANNIVSQIDDLMCSIVYKNSKCSNLIRASILFLINSCSNGLLSVDISISEKGLKDIFFKNITSKKKHDLIEKHIELINKWMISVKNGFLEIKNNIKDFPLLIIENHNLYLKRFFDIEEKILKNIKRLKTSTSMFFEEQEVYSKLSKFQNFDINQKRIITNLLKNNILLLLGKPGCGKTYLIKNFLYFLDSLGKNLDVIVLSITGKSVRNVSISKNKFDNLSIKFFTVHKLLSNIKKLNLIDTNVLIIDEVSMLNIELLNNLLSKIINSSILFLVGDFNQIEAIGINWGKSKKIINNLLVETLCTTYRVKNLEMQNTLERIRNKDVNEDVFLSSNITILDSKQQSFDEFLIKYMKNISIFTVENLNEFFQSIKKKIIISTFNHGYYGTKHINIKILNIIKKKFLNKSLLVPCMITKNYNDLNIFNGDIGGLSIRFSNSIIEESLFLIKEDKIIEINPEIIKHKEICYAISVHKSQGCEFDEIVFVVENMNYVSYSVFYSGITRAKNKVSIYTDKDKFLSYFSKL